MDAEDMYDRLEKIKLWQEPVSGLVVVEMHFDPIEQPNGLIMSMSYAVDLFKMGYNLSKAFPDVEIDLSVTGSLNKKAAASTNLLPPKKIS